MLGTGFWYRHPATSPYNNRRILKQAPNIYQQARKLYIPAKPRLIFVTEAPPTFECNRYFYFENVRKGDSLFLELMKVLFAEEVAAFENARSIRAAKDYFLGRFKEEGYFLTNACDEPLPKKTDATRAKIYQEQLPLLIKEILQIAKPKVPIVLISAVVYRAIGPSLRASGFSVLHEEAIPFPNSGQQINFRRKLRPLLLENDLLPS